MGPRPRLALELGAVAALPPPGHASWQRLLSPAELGYSLGFARAAEHLGARLVAKRAVARALAWPAPAPWGDIEIHRRPHEPPRVVLSGDLERWRGSRRLPVPGVSLSHAAGHVAALAWLPEPGARP